MKLEKLREYFRTFREWFLDVTVWIIGYLPAYVALGIAVFLIAV